MSIERLQLLQNAAVQVWTRTKRSKNITSVLKSLHWLPVSYIIDFSSTSGVQITKIPINTWMFII